MEKYSDERILAIMNKKKLVDKVFEEIEKNTSCADIKSLFTKYHLNMEIDRTKYPYIEYCISRKEIDELKRKGIINTEVRIAENVFSEDNDFDALTKLLYAIVWKNGDLDKICHIINGIDGIQDNEFESGFVFRQFGRFLENKSEPIIDQHVIRAFKVKNCKVDEIEKIDSALRIDVVDKKATEVIGSYRNWVKQLCRGKQKKETNELKEVIDDLLFSLGKTIKREKLTIAST
jgi:hypothetical protein